MNERRQDVPEVWAATASVGGAVLFHLGQEGVDLGSIRASVAGVGAAAAKLVIRPAPAGATNLRVLFMTLFLLVRG
jgi:hypothetical protein